MNEHSVHKRLAIIGRSPTEAPMWISIFVLIIQQSQADIRLRLFYDHHYNALFSNLARASHLSMIASVLAWNSGLDGSRASFMVAFRE